MKTVNKHLASCIFSQCKFENPSSNELCIKELLHQARHAGRRNPRHHATNSGAFTPYATVVATILRAQFKGCVALARDIDTLVYPSGQYRHRVFWAMLRCVMRPKWLRDPFGRRDRSPRPQV